MRYFLQTCIVCVRVSTFVNACVLCGFINSIAIIVSNHFVETSNEVWQKRYYFCTYYCEKKTTFSKKISSGLLRIRLGIWAQNYLQKICNLNYFEKRILQVVLFSSPAYLVQLVFYSCRIQCSILKLFCHT